MARQSLWIILNMKKQMTTRMPPQNDLRRIMYSSKLVLRIAGASAPVRRREAAPPPPPPAPPAPAPAPAPAPHQRHHQHHHLHHHNQNLKSQLPAWRASGQQPPAWRAYGQRKAPQTRSRCKLECFEWTPNSPSMRRESGRPLLAPPGWTPPLTHTIGPEQPSRSQKLVDVPSSVFPHSTTCYTSDRPCDLPRQPLPQSPFSTAILVY